MSKHTLLYPPASNSRSCLPWSDDNWLALLKAGVKSPEELLKRLGLSESATALGIDPLQAFKMRVPEAYVNKMLPGDDQDPLLQQVLPRQIENESVPGFSQDPLHELTAVKGNGIVYKYASRVLVVVTGACAIHCRYCFRRHFPYQENSMSTDQWHRLGCFLAQHPEVNEVILSGGDPLSVSTRRLEPLLAILDQYPQITRVRFHSRLPVVIPQRVNQSLLTLFESISASIVMVVHCNHAQELDEDFQIAMASLKVAGVTLLNQSVLLKGVNDQVETLVALSEQLFRAGVLPYYLHLLDPVQGAAHFLVSNQEARLLYTELMNRLPGFLVPKLVVEEPGQRSKTWVLPDS